MNYIDSEIILNRKIKDIVYVYVIIIIIIVLSLIILSMLFNYKTYYKIKGIIIYENNNYYTKLYIPLDDIKYIVNNNFVIIDNKKYQYQVDNINSEYLTDNSNSYQIITLLINIPSKYKLSNLTLNLKFIKENKKIINYIIRKWGRYERTK